MRLAIVTLVTDAIINSLMENYTFMAKLVDLVLHAMGDIRQQMSEASTMDNDKSAQANSTAGAAVSFSTGFQETRNTQPW